MRVLIAATGPAGERAAAALSGYDTARAGSLAAVRDQAPEAEAVVAGAVSDGDAAAVAAAVERVAPDTPVFEADDPELVTAIERAIEAARYRDAVDELYELARERATDGKEPGPALDRARSAADDAFERVRRIDDRTPYDQLLEDERESDDGDQTNS